jgi:hypothetical protein
MGSVMTQVRKYLLYFVLVFAVAFALGMLLHRHAHAQEEPMNKQGFLVEWHIRLYVTDKERHPVTYLDYSGQTFKTAVDCFKLLNKPDKKLTQTHTDIERALREKIGTDLGFNWTCGVVLVKAPDSV